MKVYATKWDKLNRTKYSRINQMNQASQKFRKWWAGPKLIVQNTSDQHKICINIYLIEIEKTVSTYYTCPYNPNTHSFRKSPFLQKDIEGARISKMVDIDGVR